MDAHEICSHQNIFASATEYEHCSFHASIEIMSTISFPENNRPFVDAEPVALHYTLLGQSVPIVAFSEIQSSALKNADFCQLLQKLGLHIMTPGQCPYIPCSWEADKLYATARKLGPLSPRKLAKLCFTCPSN